MARIPGTPGNDTLTGTVAPDEFVPLGGNDTITGGGGFDQLDYSASPAGVAVNLLNGSAQDGYGGVDVFTGIQSVVGTRFADYMAGNDFNNFFQPGEGSDAINGRSGFDTLSYAFVVNPTTSGVVGSLTSGLVRKPDGSTDNVIDIENLWGTRFADDLTGRDIGVSISNVRGYEGNDTLRAVRLGTAVAADYRGDPAGVTVNLTAGQANDGFGGVDTLVNIRTIEGSSFNDTLIGSDTRDLLRGNAGDDQISGLGGNDALSGGAGTNVLDGGDGYDQLDQQGFGLRNGATVSIAANRDIIVTRPGESTTLRNIEEISFLDGRIVFDVNDPAYKVARLYFAALGRVGDQVGLNYWIDQLNSGNTLAPLAATFLASEEFNSTYGNLSDAAFVERVYQNVLGRGSDPEGGRFWLGTLQNGASRATVLTGFSESPEFKVRAIELQGIGVWDRDESTAQVARLYDTVFDRLPDFAGLDLWNRSLRDKQLTIEQVTRAFTESSEFQATYGSLSTRGFVSQLYINSLDRLADETGLNFYSQAIDNGELTRAGVVLQFSESAEHQLLTAANVGGQTPETFGIRFTA